MLCVCVFDSMCLCNNCSFAHQLNTSQNVGHSIVFVLPFDVYSESEESINIFQCSKQKRLIKCVFVVDCFLGLPSWSFFQQTDGVFSFVH